MKLLYIANARIPTEKAHGLHIVKMCEAFAAQGVEVTLVLPQRQNAITENIFSYYGIKKNFSVRFIPVIDTADKGFVGYWLSQISFSLRLLFAGLKDSGGAVLTRDEWSGWLLAKRGCKVFYDMHGFPVKWKMLWKIAMKKMTGIICTNQWKVGQCVKVFGIARDKIILARNGFDDKVFLSELSVNDARAKIGLPAGRQIAMYTGHLYDWKGVGTIVSAAELLPEVLFVLVGGGDSELDVFRTGRHLGDNVLMIGQRPHQEMPFYLRAANVLLLSNSAHSSNPRFLGYSVYDTSPIKMFEYMASGRPIVASDLPSIREVLCERNAVLIDPDDAGLLADGITRILKNDGLLAELAVQARADAQTYTWRKRAEKIIEFIKNRC